jgi:hypothetical protein
VDVGRAQGEVKKALNEKLPGAGWGITDPAGQAAQWQSSSKGDRTSVFTLRFATAEAAAAADASVNARRIRDLNTVKANPGTVTLERKDCQLILTVPNTELKSLLEDLAAL